MDNLPAKIWHGQKPSKNPTKIFCENINKNLLNYSKNFLILPNILNLNKKL
jgi:hypothetical protein